MAGELASATMARFGHVVVALMDARNASCQRALLLTRLLNLEVLLYLATDSRYARGPWRNESRGRRGRTTGRRRERKEPNREDRGGWARVSTHEVAGIVKRRSSSYCPALERVSLVSWLSPGILIDGVQLFVQASIVFTVCTPRSQEKYQDWEMV